MAAEVPEGCPHRQVRGPGRAAEVPEGCPLTKSQYEIADLLANGASPRHVAVLRDCSVSTIRSLLCNAYERVGVHSAAALVAQMLAAGWLDHVSTDYEDEQVSAAQGLYLAAFDRWLKSQSEPDRLEMRWMLEAMRLEKSHMDGAKPWGTLVRADPDAVREIDRRHPEGNMSESRQRRPSRVAERREQYARGEIELDEFERSVTDMLREEGT